MSGHLASSKYLITFMLVSLFVFLAGAGFMVVTCIFIRRHSAAAITRVCISEAAYDNPTYKVCCCIQSEPIIFLFFLFCFCNLRLNKNNVVNQFSYLNFADLRTRGKVYGGFAFEEQHSASQMTLQRSLFIPSPLIRIHSPSSIYRSP